MDDGLREQLVAAMLGWSGGKRESQDTAREHDSGHHTPKADPDLGQQGYIRGLMQYADDEDTTDINEDIDADSALDTSDFDGRSEAGGTHNPQPRRERMGQLAPPPPQKALPALPIESPLASPQPQMSCRISSFPFSHPCDIPELMPDQDEFYGLEFTPTASGPVTPSVTTDVFRPLAQVNPPDLELGPFSPGTAQPDVEQRIRGMSVKSARSEVTGSDGLGIIREEEYNLNDDGVSIMTPTEVSFGDSSGKGNGKHGFLSVDSPPHCRSVSSLGSGSSGSADGRPSHASAPRKSVNLFSRIRGGRSPLEEEFLERRSLTPVQLSTPPRMVGYDNAGMLAPNGQSPPLSSTTSHSRSEPNTASRFFQRMPWLGDSPGKSQAVFGVDLKESLAVAPMKIRISHKGKSTSYRTFPLSVHKCCEFIRRAGGTDGTIFSSPGNPSNIATLKAIFSQPPTFGEDFRFEGSEYTVYDAARLILLFLEELPKPLISPSVAKSWILLARQEGAIEPPCPRVETGLDFWTEALNRLPTANRNLTKHLLTLFAEVLLAASGRISEADARQFASAVSRAMFHQGGEGGIGGGGEKKSRDPRKNVQPTLALAFLIRKRGEYAVSLSSASGGSNPKLSKRDSKLFLPSTKEMMEWKRVNF